MEGLEDGVTRPRQVRDPTADGAARPWLARRFGGGAPRFGCTFTSPRLKNSYAPFREFDQFRRPDSGVHHHLSAVPDRRRERPA